MLGGREPRELPSKGSTLSAALCAAFLILNTQATLSLLGSG